MKPVFPKFRSSDKELNITYDYRVSLYERHIKHTPAGYVITEFLHDVPFSGIYNTISCAAMHHFKDGRWMHSHEVLNDYATFWCHTGNPRLYSFPIADSIYAAAAVSGDYQCVDALLLSLEEIHHAWDDHKTEDGMYRQLCDRDGMVYAISGDGVRPTINSYQYADKKALSFLAARAGDTEKASQYAVEAHILREQINKKLWNPVIGMYSTVSDAGEKQNVRELIGYIPWIYGIPCEGRDECFVNLIDPNCFLSPFGLRTADASHPGYRGYIANHACLWNGPIWPFATAQTLTALISYLHTESKSRITSNDFLRLLMTYAYSHRDEDGTPWMDENMDPETGIWLVRDILRKTKPEICERGRHYNHSTFIDLVMTGICGIRPSADNQLVIHPLGCDLDFFSTEDIRYHGHIATVLFHTFFETFYISNFLSFSIHRQCRISVL